MDEEELLLPPRPKIGGREIGRGSREAEAEAEKTTREARNVDRRAIATTPREDEEPVGEEYKDSGRHRSNTPAASFLRPQRVTDDSNVGYGARRQSGTTGQSPLLKQGRRNMSRVS